MTGVFILLSFNCTQHMFEDIDEISNPTTVTYTNEQFSKSVRLNRYEIGIRL